MFTSYIPRKEELLALKAMLRGNGCIQAALIEGVPGCGKTSFAAAVAEALHSALVYHMLHSWSDDQELCCGVDIAAAVGGDTHNVRQPGVLAIACDSSQRGRTVLCLDEIDKVQERTENLLLDFLQSGRCPVKPGVHVQADPDNLLVFITSNGQRQLGDAFLRRVRRIRMRPLPESAMEKLAAKKSGVPQNICGLLLKAAMKVTERGDGAVLSVQELARLCEDIFFCAESLEDARIYLSQWAARGEAGLEVCKTVSLSAAWGEVMKSRRMK